MARKSTTRKRSASATTKSTRNTPKTTRSASSPEVANDSPTPEILPDPVAPANLGKRELIERVVEASGIKKKAAKPVIEAMLKELGDALARGDNLNLQPFGKGIVKARKAFDKAEVIELRLRRSKLAVKAAEEAAEESANPSPVQGNVTPGPFPRRDPLAEPVE